VAVDQSIGILMFLSIPMIDLKKSFFLGQSIGIDEKLGIDEDSTFQLKFYFLAHQVPHQATVLGGLLALKRAWHLRETNFGVAYSRNKLVSVQGYGM